MSENNGTIIGIDLGTSTTEAAVIKDGKPVMLFNFDNKVVTPSAIGIDASGNFIYGEQAKAQYMLSPENTVIEVKRKMGSSEVLRLGRQTYNATELSAKLLNYVREYTSAQLGEDITRAVISVPAYFDDIQRQATVKAGQDAGFTVERIINEPTAAALSYGLEHMDEESHILVYDLGGGTFDVTLLEMFGGILEVKASSGDNQLGGKDFDQSLINWLADEFQSKHGISLRKNPAAMAKLKEQAELCKIALSTQECCQVTIPFIAKKKDEPLSLDETVTVERFEALIAPILDRTHKALDVVFADSGLRPSDINLILLVGGSTQIPLVRKNVSEYLSCTPQSPIDPNFAVAQGAAIQAGIISGVISDENSLIMTDVNPYTLGIRTTNGYTDNCMSVIIPRNITIPVTREEIYTTHWDYQQAAKIAVYQGEAPVATSNHFLGEFTVTGIPPAPAGHEKIGVEFSYNMNGMLSVNAVIKSTGAQASIEINMHGQTKNHPQIDVSTWKSASGASEYRAVVRRTERALKHAKLKEENPPLYTQLTQLLYELKAALINQLDNIEEIEDALLDLLDIYDQIYDNG